MERDVNLLGPLLRSLVWADRGVRQKIQQYGVNIVPVNFYSNTPSIDDITGSYEYTQAAPPYLVESIFDAGRLASILGELSSHASEFDPPVDGDEASCKRFFWKNSQFSYSDAMSYYCFLRMLEPRKLVEIGSGFSTLVAVEAVRRNGAGTITCIEPFPRPFLRDNPAIDLREMRAQDVTPEWLDDALEDGDVLFIDSTHTVKTGSDCLHIYLRLLPQIRKNIFIHVHDVFLPYGLPMEWMLDQQIYWTEQYLLLAWLLDNPRATVLYGSNYHHKFDKPALDSLMCGRYPSGGGSFWIEYRGRRGASAVAPSTAAAAPSA
jgi:hypothetical protein